MKYLHHILIFIIIFSAVSCQKEEDNTLKELGNDCINRSNYVPYIAGSTMEFAYAMFMPSASGRIEEAKVECTYPGAEGTYLEHNSYTTDDQGQDVPTQIGNPCIQSDNTYSVSFTVDTVASTLRFHYVVPDEARGQEISFKFSVRADNGQTAEYVIDHCFIRKMEMKLDIPITPSSCFISIDKMQSYTKQQAEFINVPIDIIWGYTYAISDAESIFMSAAQTEKYSKWFSFDLPNCQLNDTRKMLRYTIIEPQLGRQEFDGFYIDDRDFETLNIVSDVDGLAGIFARNGFWVETADGKYRAYIYCNYVSIDKATISIKRYTMF